ncbi:ABC transporter permease, partial [Streptomyces parvus]
MKKFDKDRLILGFAGPVLALVVALALTTVVLLASGQNPFEPYRIMFESASYADVQVLIINQAGTY